MKNNFRFITHEIGSLAKPEWRVKMARNKAIGKREIDEAVSWGKRLGLEYEPLVELLKKSPRPPLIKGEKQDAFTAEEKGEIRRWASVYGLGLVEKAGIDVVYDGEQYRSEMYQHAVNLSEGFVFRGLARSFDNKYYQKAACVSKPRIRKPWHVDELLILHKLTEHKIKVPITGAYTIAAWSFDEYYGRKASALGSLSGFASKAKARRQFVLDIAKHLIRPNIKLLLENGAEWIQIDEPAAATDGLEVPLLVESFNESVKGLSGEFSIHICFSDYRLLFPHIQRMENCSQYAIEFANRDSRELGVKEGDRPGYEILKWFKKYKIPSRIGLGVNDIHTDFVELAELTRDRILYATKVLGDPALINPTPDCGLRTRTWEVAFEKLKATVEGARLAEKEI